MRGADLDLLRGIVDLPQHAMLLHGLDDLDRVPLIAHFDFSWYIHFSPLLVHIYGDGHRQPLEESPACRKE